VTNIGIKLFNKLPAQIKQWTIINVLREEEKNPVQQFIFYD